MIFEWSMLKYFRHSSSSPQIMRSRSPTAIYRTAINQTVLKLRQTASTDMQTTPVSEPPGGKDDRRPTNWITRTNFHSYHFRRPPSPSNLHPKTINLPPGGLQTWEQLPTIQNGYNSINRFRLDVSSDLSKASTLDAHLGEALPTCPPF